MGTREKDPDGAPSSTYDVFLRGVAQAPSGTPPPEGGAGELGRPEEPDLVGRSLLQFRVDERLGGGGMGVVYKAFDEKLQRHVALKVLKRPALADVARALFREARLAARLTHPSIAAMYEVHEAESPPFLVMEYVAGLTLRATLAQGPMRPERALPIARDIAVALAAAHALGVVHRDLKPDNVMLPAGGGIKLLDFGIAAAVDGRRDDAPGPATSSAVDTLGGHVAGTPEYMSPEQTTAGRVDARTDVFALGVVLYQMLTGRSPFRRDTAEHTFAAVRDEEPAALDPAVGKDGARIVQRCLAKRAEERFADAGELERALAAASSSTVAPPRRLPALLGLAIVPLVVVATVLAARTLRPTGAPRAAPSSSSAAEAPPVVKIADLPPPVTASPDALSHYLTAMRDLHDATAQAHAQFGEAARIDPSFAAAQLRLALLTGLPAARRPMGQAERYRDSLDARDQALMEAEEPLLLSEPPDEVEAGRRLAALQAERPNDVEILGWVGRAQMATHPDLAGEAFARALDLDPSYAAAEGGLGSIAEKAGRWDEAEAHYKSCVRISTIAAGCWLQLARLYGRRGNCTAFAETVGKAMTLDSDEFFTDMTELSALLGTSATRDETNQVLERALGTTFVKGRPLEAQHNAAYRLRGISALWYGSMAEARRLLDHMESSSIHGLRDILFAERIAVVEQMGDEGAARALAAEYAASRASQAPLALDGLALRALRAHHALAPAAADSLRDRWLAQSVGDAGAPTWREWVRYWAEPAVSIDDAVAALAKRDAYPVVPESPGTRESAGIGHVLLLAGRAAEALPWLEDAAFACQPIVIENENSFVPAIVMAAFELGHAREAAGDPSGACTAYQRVLDRWGNATPRSTTADAARARMQALRCGG